MSTPHSAVAAYLDAFKEAVRENERTLVQYQALVDAAERAMKDVRDVTDQYEAFLWEAWDCIPPEDRTGLADPEWFTRRQRPDQEKK